MVQASRIFTIFLKNSYNGERENETMEIIEKRIGRKKTSTIVLNCVYVSSSLSALFFYNC